MAKNRYQIRTFKDCIPAFFMTSFVYIGVLRTLSIFEAFKQTDAITLQEVITAFLFGLFITTIAWIKQKRNRKAENTKTVSE